MTLTIDIEHALPAFELKARLEIGDGLTALFGPSGAGKTTIINLVAGLVRPDRGRISFNGTVWADAGQKIFVPPHRRRVGYVFQDARLFPHLSVEGNLLYGQRFVPRAERRESLDQVADLLGLKPLLTRRPAVLSGGEKQRVALGRALLTSPHVLLMDEPLSALDNALKAAIMPYIERVRDEAGVPILYVSHSTEEVARLATRVVTVRDGRASVIGEPGDLARALPGIEGITGAGSFLHARIESQFREEGLTAASSPAGPLFLRYTDLPIGAAVRVLVPSSDIVVAVEPVGAVSTLNRLKGTIVSLEVNGTGVTLRIDCNGEVLSADVTKRSAASLSLAPGLAVTLLLKALSIGPEALFRATALGDLPG